MLPIYHRVLICETSVVFLVELCHIDLAWRSLILDQVIVKVQ